GLAGALGLLLGAPADLVKLLLHLGLSLRTGAGLRLARDALDQALEPPLPAHGLLLGVRALLDLRADAALGVLVRHLEVAAGLLRGLLRLALGRCDALLRLLLRALASLVGGPRGELPRPLGGLLLEP